MERICLETDILVDFLRDEPAAVSYVEDREGDADLATTTVNAFELFHGAYKSGKRGNVEATKELISRLTLLDMDARVAEAAGKELAELEDRGDPIEFRDLLIGTIASERSYPLKTNNMGHFERIDGLELC